MPAETSEPAPKSAFSADIEALKRKRSRLRPDKIAKDRERMAAAFYYLQPKERLFVAGVAQGMKYQEAARAAGFEFEGKALDNKCYLLMKRPLIRAAIYQAVSQAFGKASIETDQTLREVATIAFMPDALLEGRPTWRDKTKCLELLCHFQRLLDKHVVHEGEIGVVELIRGSARREQLRLEAETAIPATFVEKPAEHVNGKA